MLALLVGLACFLALFFAFFVGLGYLISPGLDSMLPVRSEFTQIELALDAFRREFGHLPDPGDNRVVMRQLRGGNDGGLVFIEFRSQSWDEERGMLDPWGTPYRIEIGDAEYRVSSAGRDREFGTRDDESVQWSPPPPAAAP